MVQCFTDLYVITFRI